jgi:hypothetical protein
MVQAFGRIEKAVLSSDDRKLQVDDSGLNHGGLRHRIHLDDPPHAGHLKGDASVDRHSAARQAGAGAPRDDGDAVLGREENDIRDLLGRRGQDNGIGHRAFDGSIALENPKVQVVVDDVLVADDAPQLLADGS